MGVFFGSDKKDNSYKKKDDLEWDNEYDKSKRKQADIKRRERVKRWNHLIDGYVSDKSIKKFLYVTKVSEIPKKLQEVKNDSFYNQHMSYQLAKLQHLHATSSMHQIDNLIKELE